MVQANTSTKQTSGGDQCAAGLSGIDAFLYGLPAGLLLSGLLLLCFITFGNAITARKERKPNISASSHTRTDKQDQLGKKRKRGPQPSSDLRPVDVLQMALREDAPDDIKAMALAGKLAKKP